MKKIIATLGSVVLLAGLTAAPALAASGGGDDPTICREVENPDYEPSRIEYVEHEATYETIHNEAVYDYVDHPAEYETVHHEAVTSTEVEWKWWGYKNHGTKVWTDGAYPTTNPNPWPGDWRLTGNEREVVVEEAWDEQVLVKEAWTEEILLLPAWDEEVIVEEAWTETVVIPAVGEPTIEECPPAQPEPKVLMTELPSGTYICATEPWNGTVVQEIIRTTTTTPYVWNAEAWQWVFGKSVVVREVVGLTDPEPHSVLCQPTPTPTPQPTSSAPVTPVTIPQGEDPTPVVATTVVHRAEVLAAGGEAAETLADTGNDSALTVAGTAVGLALLGTGLAGLASRRRKASAA